MQSDRSSLAGSKQKHPTNLIYLSTIMTLEWWKEVTLYYDSSTDQWICENRELEKKIQLSMKELRQPLRNSFLLPNPSILTKDQIWVIPVIPEPPVGWFEGNVCNPWFFPSTRIHKDRANVLLISPLGALNTSPIKVDWDHRPFDRFPVQFRRRSAPQERPCPSWRHLLSAHPPGGDGDDYDDLGSALWIQGSHGSLLPFQDDLIVIV